MYVCVYCEGESKIVEDIYAPSDPCTFLCMYVYVCMYVCMYVGDNMEEEQTLDGGMTTQSSNSNKRRGGGNSSTSYNSGSQNGNEAGGRKRFRRLKIRYAGLNRNAIEALEEAWGEDVEFQH